MPKLLQHTALPPANSLATPVALHCLVSLLTNMHYSTQDVTGSDRGNRCGSMEWDEREKCRRMYEYEVPAEALCD